MMSLLQIVLLFAFPALVITAALKDVTSYTIPNWISLALIAAFFPACLALGVAAPTIGLHAAIGAGALVAGMVMFALGWIGGGDAKLFAAAGLWLGWPAGVTFLLVTCIAGGALAVGLLSLRSVWFRPYVTRGPAWFSRLATTGENVPYGAAICVGALAAFPSSTLMTAFSALG